MGDGDRAAMQVEAARSTGQTEDDLVEALGRLLEIDDVPPDHDFFDDLGADSMVVAALCAHLRTHTDLPAVSIREVYEHPTAASLAEHLDDSRSKGQTTPRDVGSEEPIEPSERVGSFAYWVCGLFQLLTLLILGLVVAVLVEASYNLIAPASGVGATYVRSIVVGAGLFGILVVFPIAAKWLIIGRWKPRRIRLWTPSYYRFWLGRTAALSNPLRVFVGSPIYVLYLRAMGASVGRGAVVLSRRVPVCTDLLSIGDSAVVREDASLSCYRADGPYLELGSVEIGEAAVVGHSSVLDIRTRVGDSSQLGHMSALSPGQSVPDGAHMVGTGATTSSGFDFADVPAVKRTAWRRFGYAVLQLAFLFLVAVPLATSLGVAFLEWRANAANVSVPTVVLAALALFVVLLLSRFVLAVGAGRFLGRFVEADTAYPLYGVRYVVHRLVRRFTNVGFLGRLVGDSSYVLNYYQAIGYDVSFEEQTGANFGNRVRHDNPLLVSAGPGTMAADDLVMVNADYSASSFRLGHVDIGAHSFFGNTIIYPSQAKTTDNCLLASKVMVPLEGPERTDVGFLGSPSFEIPRMVFRDKEFEALRRSEDFPKLLAGKNRHNVGSMGWFLLARFVGLLGLVAIAFGVGELLDGLGPFGVFAGILAATVVAPAYRVFVERASIRFGRLQPTHCSIYDLDLWQVERYWKLSWEPRVLNATPFKPLFWRMLGVRVGRRLFDDGCSISEKTMASIGDDCSFNAHSHIQSHSLEDGSYKSDFVEIGSGCTLGVGGLIHYGAVMEDGSSLEANSFMMKGTIAPAGTTWGENPARELDSGQRHSAAGALAGSGEPAAVDAERYWRDVLLSGGYTPIPRWTSVEDGPERETDVALAEGLPAQLAAMADRYGTTENMLLLAVHARVVASLTGESEVAVGLVQEAGSGAVPCRLTVSDESWEDLVHAAIECGADALRHSGVDVRELMSELNLRGPLFESAVDASGTMTQLPEDALLMVALNEDVNGARLRIRFESREFDEESATRIARYHARALETLCEEPSVPANGASVLSSEELDYQVHALAGPDRDLPDQRLHELFEERVERHPEAIAGRCLQEQWSYAELNERANKIARTLLENGVEDETVVAVVTERNLGWMAAVVGIFKAGAVYLPIEPHFPSGRIEKTLARAGCELVITEEGSTATLDGALASLPSAQTLMIADAMAHEDGSNLGLVVGLDQLAYIYFTSGSTGEPKGAMCEHAGMLNHMYAKLDDLGVREGEVVAQIAPQCFDISLWQLVAPLLVGGCTLIVDQDTILQPESFVDLIVESEVGVMQVVPSYLEVLLTYLDQHPRELGSLHCVSATGEALTLELAQRWFSSQPDIKLVNAYGLTETSDDTNHEVMTEAPEGSVSLGPAVNNVTIYVVDENLDPVPLGAPGEITFSGICVGRGYINDPERTAQVYLDDPIRPGNRLYRSGDFGRWSPDGKLEYLGRRDAQVKIRGFRIEIGEIENVLAQMDGVRQGAVVITGDDDNSKQLVAFYTGAEHPVDALREHLGGSLPEYMVPSAFHWRDELPLSDNGKINRRALRELAGELETGIVEYESPITPTETRLVALWSGILDLPVDEIGRRDHFFDRGGSSLSAVELVIGLENAVTLKEVTAAPVLADMARVVDGESVEEAGLLHRLTAGGGGGDTSLICLPYAGGNAVNYQAVAQALRGTNVAVHAVELPGHELLGSDDDFASLDEVADRVVAEIIDTGIGPVGLWGHSAGSALALEVARRLEEAGRVVQAVFIGAQLLGDASTRRVHLEELTGTSDRKIVAAVSAGSGYGDLEGLDAAQVGHLGAAIRHDVVASSRYLIEMLENDDGARLSAPLVVAAAKDDGAVTNLTDRCAEWERFSDEVHCRELDIGGHFFIRTEPELAALMIREFLLGETAEPIAPSDEAPTHEADVSEVVSSSTDLSTSDAGLPLVVVRGGPTVAQWADQNRELLLAELLDRGKLLVRGLTVSGSADVAAIAAALSESLVDDTESFAPREEHPDGVFSSSAWPANQQMCMHHELSYRQTVPGLMVFGCVQGPESGGAIPVADATEMLEALPSKLVERFKEQGWILRRNYTEDIGLSLGDAFGTDDRDEIESYCSSNEIEFDWRSDGTLTTQQWRPAIVEHPASQESCWFNQVAFLNEWTMKPEVRDYLVSAYGDDGLPFTTLFGDGEPVGLEVVETINSAYDSCTLREPLQSNDLLIVDNIATAHSRDPYKGDREVVVALGDPTVLHVDLTDPKRSSQVASPPRN